MDVKTTYALFRLKSVQKSLQSWQLVSMYLFYYSNEFTEMKLLYVFGVYCLFMMMIIGIDRM